MSFSGKLQPETLTQRYIYICVKFFKQLIIFSKTVDRSADVLGAVFAEGSCMRVNRRAVAWLCDNNDVELVVFNVVIFFHGLTTLIKTTPSYCFPKVLVRNADTR